MPDIPEGFVADVEEAPEGFVPDALDFKDLSANQPLRLNLQAGRVTPLGMTTSGGPRVPVASLAVTMVEPIEAMTTPRLTTPKLTIQSGESLPLSVGKEALNIASSIPEFLSSNVGIASLVTGATAPAATAGAFTVDMLGNLGNQILSTYRNWGSMTANQKAAAITDIVGTGGMAGLMAHATARAIRGPAQVVPPKPPITGEFLRPPAARGVPTSIGFEGEQAMSRAAEPAPPPEPPPVAPKPPAPESKVATDLTPEQEYDASLAAFKKASQEFTKIQKAYRAKEIGDAEFLAGRKAFDEAQAVADTAERKFIDTKNKEVAPASPAETVDPGSLTPEQRKNEGWIEAWRQDRSDALADTFRPGSHFGTKEQAEAIAKREIESGRTPGKLHHVWLRIKNPFETTDEGFWEKPTKEAIAKGHDSLVYENEGEGVGGKSYVPFSADQIRPFKELPPAETSTTTTPEMMARSLKPVIDYLPGQRENIERLEKLVEQTLGTKALVNARLKARRDELTFGQYEQLLEEWERRSRTSAPKYTEPERLPPPPADTGEGKAKEPWQMTKAEYENGPPVKKGFVRLWRGEYGEPNAKPEEYEERWFTTSREVANFFAALNPSTSTSRIMYVDIPAKDLSQYDAYKILPEKQKPVLGDEQAYILPRELASTKKYWVDYHSDGHGDLVATAKEQGKPVPPEVLADYPDLQPKAPTPPAAEAGKGEGREVDVSERPERLIAVNYRKPGDLAIRGAKRVGEKRFGGVKYWSIPESELANARALGATVNRELTSSLIQPTEPTQPPPTAAAPALGTKEGMPPGPGAQTAGTDVPPGAQIEQLSQAFRQITAQKTPLLQKIKEAFDLGKKRELSQNLIARTLSALKTSGDYLIETWKGQRSLDPILKAKGELSAELETRGWRLRQAMKDMKRAVPSKAAREAISKYVDAGGDMEKLRQSAETVPAGRRAPYIRAMQLTPDEKVIAGHIQSFFEARLQEAIDAGVLSHGIEDYIHRIYPQDTEWRRGVINAVQNSLLDTRTPGLAKQRVFELDADAERAGHFPVSDFIPRILDYEASLSKVIASRAAVKKFTEIKMPDGRPMLDVSGIGVPIENAEGIREATLIKPSFKPGEAQFDDTGRPTKNFRKDYQSRDYPALKKWKWATNDAEGNPIFVQGDVLIHPDAVHRVDALLEPSKVRRYAAARAALTVGSVFKQTMLDFSGFHQVQIAIHGLEHKVNPFNLVKDVDTNHPDVRGLLKGGMTLGGQHVSGMYQEGLVGRSLSRQIPGIGQLMQSYHDWLFQNFIPRVKTTMALHALERNRGRFAKELASGQMTQDALYHQTAKEANAAFGEQNYIMLERSKTAQDMARLVLLAPDFLEARGRFALQAGTRLGGEQRMALLLGAVTLYTTARLMNKALNDEWHFEPENMFSVIHNGKAYSIRTVQGDILHALESPVRFWMHRLNPALSRPLFELMTQRDEFGRKRSFWQVMGDTISNAVPISMRASREQSIWTSLLNAFGGSVRRDSDISRVYQEATKWKAKNGIRTEPGEFIYDSSKDIYRPLKLALLDGDTEGAAREYGKLMASKVVTPAQALKHFQTYAHAPFSGAKKNERRFYESLTKDQQHAYQGAKQEKERILQSFLKARQLAPQSNITEPAGFQPE